MAEKYVFISYKVEEYDGAKAVKDHLEANGIPCWMAPMSIRGGMSYAQEIPPAIQNCSVFLLMLSEKAQASKWVPREVDQAINCGKLIMPFMTENCPLRSDFSFYLTNVQRYEAFRDPEETLERMTRDILNALGIQPPAREEPAPEPVAEKPKETPKPKSVKKEKKPAGKKEKWLPLLLAGGLLAAGVLLLALLLPGKPTVGGINLDKDTFSITLKDVTLTQKDLDSLPSFPNLGVIRLENCVLEAEDLSPMAVPGLMALELTGCNLTDAQFATIDFSTINYFSELRVDGNPALTSIEGVAVCAETLTELDISDTGIQSFAWLSAFTKLEVLKADRTGLQDTALLEAMIYLEELSLSGNGITGLDGLKNTSKLSKVDLSHNSLTEVSVLSRSAETLTVLHLEQNMLTNLSCLSETANLKKVYVDGNELTSLSWLQNNQGLQILSASHNQIKSLHGLGIGEKLHYLNLSNNQLWAVSEGTLLFGENNYPVVDLSNNDLQVVYLPQNCTYKQLALLGNPNLDITYLIGLNGWNVYFDFPAAVKLETLQELNFSSICMVDCPLDRQVEIEDGLSNDQLMTREEAQEAIAQAAQNEAY